MWKNLLILFVISSAAGSKYAKLSGSITWNDLLKTAKYATGEFLKNVEPYISELYPYGNVSEKCTNSLIRFRNGLKKWEPWTVRMADANGKFPSGFLTGTMTDFGSYDECLSLRVNSNNESESFKGQFCMMSLQSHLLFFPEKLTPDGRTYEEAYGTLPDWIAGEMEEAKGFSDAFGLFLGICTPSVCSQEDISNIIKAITKPAELKVSVEDCHTDEPRKFPTYTIVTVVFLSFWLGIVLLGTALDVFYRFYGNVQTEQQNESTGSQMLKAFSLCTNIEKFLDTKDADSPLGYLFGLKFILCQWILFGHVYFYEDYWKYQRYNNFNNFSKLMTLETLILDCAPLSVDIFLVIRLMSPTIFLILITFVIPFISNGPIWNTTLDFEVEKCRNYGWSNLLFIHNIYNTSQDMCWTHTWYISAALQIQIASFLLLAIVERFPKTGITIGFLAVFGCFAQVVSVAYEHKFKTFSVVIMRSPEKIHSITTEIYMKPFLHFPSHVIGMVAGYIAKKKPEPPPMKYQTIGWISFIIILTYVVSKQWVVFSVEIIPLFISTVRNTLWAASWAWFVFALTTNQGTLNKFLSWKLFIPLGKLCYGIYIYHVLAMIVKIAIAKDLTYMGKVPNIVEYCAISASGFVLAFIGHIAVETPVNVLCDLWDGKGSSPSFTCARNEDSKTKENISESENVSKKEL